MRSPLPPSSPCSPGATSAPTAPSGNLVAVTVRLCRQLGHGRAHVHVARRAERARKVSEMFLRPRTHCPNAYSCDRGRFHGLSPTAAVAPLLVWLTLLGPACSDEDAQPGAGGTSGAAGMGGAGAGGMGGAGAGGMGGISGTGGCGPYLGTGGGSCFPPPGGSGGSGGGGGNAGEAGAAGEGGSAGTGRDAGSPDAGSPDAGT
jgi:hypothetical protein